MGGVSRPPTGLAYAPIYDMGGRQRVHAIECAPSSVLDAASGCAAGALPFVTEALGEASSIPGRPEIWLRVCRRVLEDDPEFLVTLGDLAAANGIGLERITLVTSADEPCRETAGFCNTVEGLHAVGGRLALASSVFDDRGVARLLGCRPDYLKLERALVRGVRGDFHRLQVLRAVVDFARRLGMRPVSEGTDEPGDRELVSAMGVQLFAGSVRAALAFDDMTGPSTVEES